MLPRRNLSEHARLQFISHFTEDLVRDDRSVLRSSFDGNFKNNKNNEEILGKIILKKEVKELER